MSLGPNIFASADTPQLPIQLGPERYQVPVAAWGDWIVLSEHAAGPPKPHPTETFEFWNVATKEKRTGWETPQDTQDGVWDISGDWLVTVRTGLSLPFPEWHLIVRNLRTGEAREIAQDDQAVASLPNLRVALPSGFAPTPSISGERIVWPEVVLDPVGKTIKQIQLFDLASGTKSTLASVDSSREDLWQPSIAGDEVAWAHRAATGAQELVVVDMARGTQQTFAGVGKIYSCALSADGHYLAWDDDYTAKYARDLSRNEVVTYAGDEGWGTDRSGGFVSWQPSTASFTSGVKSNGDGGFYDFNKHQVRFVASRENSTIIMATVMGDWFVWQDRRGVPWSSPPNGVSGDPADAPSDNFYFMKLNS